MIKNFKLLGFLKDLSFEKFNMWMIQLTSHIPLQLTFAEYLMAGFY